MTESLASLLLRLSEAGDPALMWGRQAKLQLGREFDRLLDRGLLSEQAPADEWDVCADCECGLDQRPIQRIDGSLVAACPFNHANDVCIEPEDLRSFRVDAALIPGEIAAASGFAEPSQVMPGIWYLGKTLTKRCLFIALTRASVLSPGLISVLRATDHGQPITFVGPSVAAADLLRFTEAGIHFVATAEAFVAEGTAFALDARKLMPPASIEARLTLFRSHSKIVLDGGELELPPISFKLLCLLAEQVVRGDGVVSRQQIDKHLWSTVVSKTAAADAIRNLRDSLKKLDEGSNAAALVRTLPTQGYILDIAASDIRLMD